MKFEDWMIYRGLSASSADKYVGAIEGPLSKWAIENKLLAGPLTAISSLSNFNEVASAIHYLPIFKERNERGHNMYSSALAKFSEYLSEGYGNDVEVDIDSILDDDNLEQWDGRSHPKRHRSVPKWKCFTDHLNGKERPT